MPKTSGDLAALPAQRCLDDKATEQCLTGQHSLLVTVDHPARKREQRQLGLRLVLSLQLLALALPEDAEAD